jgi:translocation protein SEC62
LKPEKRKGDIPDIIFLGTNRGDIPGTFPDVVLDAGKGEKGEATNYYVWLWEGDQTMSNFMTGGIVTAFLLITCFPIWPQIMKVILWYISCTILVFIFSLILIRWFLFLFVWIFGFEFWILPNLFDEERSVMDSFKPFLSFEKTGPGQLWWRMAVLFAFVGTFYWGYTQPTEFDDFLKSNKQFVDDLYEGNLLSDMAQFSKDNIDNPYKIPSIEDLLSDMEHDMDPSASFTEERVENVNFLEEPDEEEEVDALLDSLFDDEE